MLCLTTVPRELRDQILEYVIQAHQNEPPALEQTFEELTQRREILSNPRLGSWCHTVLNIPESVTANTTSLLLVNRQLYTETLANIKRLHVHAYKLDVVILDEILPLLTWLHVPLISTRLDRVDVNFRISGCYDRNKEGRRGRKEEDFSVGLYDRYPHYKGFSIGCGAGPAMGWQIYSIFERFIKAGPRGEIENELENCHMVVKTLHVNIETPQDVDPALFGPPRSSHHGRQIPDASVLNPRYLARFIEQDIDGLLKSGDSEWFSYGKLLYEHVDVVVMSLDGKESATFDIATKLKYVDGFDDRRMSKEALEEYKSVTWEKRRERGLKVL
jgi:hypothetical protein